MTTNEEKIAVAAFLASLGNQVSLSEESGMVQIQGPFNLGPTLMAAFTALEKHKRESAIMRAKTAEEIVIFDP